MLEAQNVGVKSFIFWGSVTREHARTQKVHRTMNDEPKLQSDHHRKPGGTLPVLLRKMWVFICFVCFFFFFSESAQGCCQTRPNAQTLQTHAEGSSYHESPGKTAVGLPSQTWRTHSRTSSLETRNVGECLFC